MNQIKELVIRVVIGYQHMHVNDSLKREPDK